MHFCVHSFYPLNNLANSSYWKLFSSLVTAFLISSEDEKLVPFTALFSLERAKSHRVFDLENTGSGQELWFLFWPLAASHWLHCVQVHCHFSHPQIIHISHPKIIHHNFLHWFPVVEAEFIPNQLHCQSAIILHQLLHSWDAIISFRCGRSSGLEAIFNFLTSILEMFVPFKGLCSWHHIFAINLFKKF